MMIPSFPTVKVASFDCRQTIKNTFATRSTKMVKIRQDSVSLKIDNSGHYNLVALGKHTNHAMGSIPDHQLVVPLGPTRLQVLEAQSVAKT